MDHATPPGAAAREVPDPYYGPAAGFDQVLDLVEDACDGFVRRNCSAQLPGPASKALAPAKLDQNASTSCILDGGSGTLRRGFG